MEHEPSDEVIKERLAPVSRHNYLRDWVYGGMDGSVMTTAVVAGVIGAHLGSVVIVFVGLATLAGVGFLRAARNFLGSQSEHDEITHLTAIERRHIDSFPEGDREEVRQIFAAKGFAGADLERVVELITSDRERWVRTLLSEEYGLPQQARSPWLASITTFSAFVICGLAPLIAFFISVSNPLRISLLMTGVLLFVIGSVRSRWSTVPWWRSGLAMVFVGGVAGGLSYAVGVLLRNLVS